MPSNPNGALGSLDFSKEERRALATKSRQTPPKYASPDRQKLIDEIHRYMLSKAPSAPQTNSDSLPHDAVTTIAEPDTVTEENLVDQITEEAVLPRENAAVEVPARGDTGNGPVRRQEQQTVVVRAAHKPADDRLFTWAAVGLMIAIVVLLLKKFVRSSGHGAVFMDES